MADPTDFSSTQGYQNLFNQIANKGYGGAGITWDTNTTKQTLDQLSQQISNSFQNNVGRAPTTEEMDKAIGGLGQQLLGSTGGFAQIHQNPTQTNDLVNQYVGQNFQNEAKSYATQQLAGQQQQASSLADTFRQQGTQAINSTAQMLQDYQSQLFQRLQPQLLTSLQAQGLLNTGALNEAEAGKMKDLASESQGFLANANLNMQNQANAIQFGGQSAPYYYQQGQIMNQVPYLQQQANMALNQNNFQNNQQQQAGLQGYLSMLQNNQMVNNQPSMLQRLGQGFASGFGASAGQQAANIGTGFLNSGYQSGGGSSQNPFMMSQMGV